MKPSARRRARETAVQALYQTLLNDEVVTKVAAQYLADMDVKKVDVDYFKAILFGVIAQMQQIDDSFSPFLDRQIHELTPIELCVLRLAVYELKVNLDVPYRVVMNEALELTKKFGTQEGFKFVNGVLDKTAARLRYSEYKK